MSEQLFDVVFFGILQAGKDKETVMQNMATMFKTDASKLTPYFAGGRKVIKAKINAEAAEKYQATLENIGLVIKVEPCDMAQDSATLAKETSSQTSTQTKTDTQQADTQADTGNLSIAPVGADVIENPAPIAAQVIADISNLSMAEVGSDILEHPAEVVVQKIADISELSLAETDDDSSDKAK